MNDATDDLHSNEVNREYWIYLSHAFLRDAKALRGKAQTIVERLAATTDDVPAQLVSSSSSGTTPAGCAPQYKKDQRAKPGCCEQSLSAPGG
jgi:hypothetical protein